MTIIISFFSGLIMAIGLIVSGMVNPQKVLGFLDVFGRFDPTLVFVMLGALCVAAMGYRLIRRCSKPILCDGFDKSSKNQVDAPLIFGAALFGLGWGLAGFCPAPVIVGVGLGVEKSGIFIIAMLIGMFLARRVAN